MKWLLALALMLTSALALAQRPDAGLTGALSLDAVLRRLRAVPAISARFREEKRMQLLAAPLVSEGTLHYASGRLVRRTLSPDPAVALLEGGRLRFRDASGEQTLDLDAMPTARQFLESFTALVAGDRAALERSYVLGFVAEGAGDRWSLSLRPRPAALARVFREVIVRGTGVALSTIVVRETSGDESVTTFSDVRTDRALPADEAARVFRLTP